MLPSDYYPDVDNQENCQALTRSHAMTVCKRLGIALIGFLLLSPVPSRGDERATGFVHRIHKGADGTEAKYVVFVPHDYRGDRPYPLILFLHGAGEWGSDGQKQVTVGL